MQGILDGKFFDTEDCEIVKEENFQGLKNEEIALQVLLSPKGVFLIHYNSRNDYWYDVAVGEKVTVQDDRTGEYETICLIDKDIYEKILYEDKEYKILVKYFGLERG